MKGGLTIKTIPKTIQITFSKSIFNMGSLMNSLAENTVKIGDVAVISAASDKGRCCKQE